MTHVLNMLWLAALARKLTQGPGQHLLSLGRSTAQLIGVQMLQPQSPVEIQAL